MSDETAPAENAVPDPRPDPEPHPDPEGESARALYLAWRNQHLGALPSREFNRIEAAAEFLIAEIAALLKGQSHAL